MPYVIVGDAGFYQRAAVKDALALLRLSASPDDRQSDEAFRRVANKPARGLGAKALGLVEVEAGWREVSLLAAVETPTCRRRPAPGCASFCDTLRATGAEPTDPVAAPVAAARAHRLPGHAAPEPGRRRRGAAGERAAS